MGASELSWWLKKGKDEDKSEEQWKTIWVVVLIVIILVLLSGLTASVAVFILNYNQDQTQRWTKGVEGYPAWEEVVDLILEAEQNLPEIVNVGVIGRCVHLCTCVYLCTLVCTLFTTEATGCCMQVYDTFV